MQAEARFRQAGNLEVHGEARGAGLNVQALESQQITSSQPSVPLSLVGEESLAAKESVSDCFPPIVTDEPVLEVVFEDEVEQEGAETQAEYWQPAWELALATIFVRIPLLLLSPWQRLMRKLFTNR